MRSAILAVLLLPAIIFSQDDVTAPKAAAVLEHQYNFAGGASLSVGQDSMTDRQTCVATTSQNSSALILVAGGDVATISTFQDVDFDSAALLRIGDGTPLRLVPRGRRALIIPLRQSPEVIRALYTQRRVRLRFLKWPNGVFDEDLKIGDFAAAYDRAVELCGWPKMKVAAVHPAPDVSDSEPVEVSSPDFGWYFDAIQRRIEVNWLVADITSSKPVSTHCVVTFSIARGGGIKNVRLELKSEEGSMDAAAQRAVLASDPMPPLPTDYPGSDLVVRAEFEAKLVPRGVLYHGIKVTAPQGP